MTEPGEEDEALTVLAGEFVLGTLTDAEEADFRRRLAKDTRAAAEVALWRTRLDPLAATATEVPVPGHVWPLIEARLDRPVRVAANDNRVSPLWRAGAVAASLLALVMSAVALRPNPAATTAPTPERGPTYVAAVTPSGAEPALLVTLDPTTGRALVRAINLVPPERRSLELWYIGGGRDPKSLGLVAGDARMEMVLEDAIRHGDRFDASQFAVSIEPVGGSPKDAPTGTIVYSGKVMPVSGA